MHVQAGSSLHNAFILLAFLYRESRGGRGADWGGKLQRKEDVVVDSSSSRLSLTSSPSSPSSSLPTSKLWHRIPHMPLIWSEATQERSYLTAVEFSTLASDVSPEAIKQQKAEWGVLRGWVSGATAACE